VENLINKKMKKKIAILFLISSIGVQSQLKLENLSGKKEYGLLQRLELNIISLVPTVDKYKKFSKNVKNLPLEYIKYVDSIDYSNFNKKHIVIQIYSQSRAYRSENSYNIKKNDKNDSLLVTNISLNMKMKDFIEYNYIEYKNQKVKYKIIEKKIKTNKKINRIIFSKLQNKKEEPL